MAFKQIDGFNRKHLITGLNNYISKIPFKTVNIQLLVSQEYPYGVKD